MHVKCNWPPNGDRPVAPCHKRYKPRTRCLSTTACGTDRRTSPGAGGAKDIDHKGLKQLQLFTRPNMSQTFYTPCLRAKVLRAGNGAAAKIHTRTPLAQWSLVGIAHRSSCELAHREGGWRRRGKTESGEPKKAAATQL